MKKDELTLLMKYFTNSCSDQEKRQIEQRITTDAEFARHFAQLKQINHVEENITLSKSPNEVWADLRQKMLQSDMKKKKEHLPDNLYMLHHSRHNYATVLLRIAAMLLLTVGLSYFFTDGFQKLPWNQASVEKFKTVQVGYKQRQKIKLSDGTQVTLDAGSELRFAKEFNSSRRDVYLKGEGYFEVAHDLQRPFYVHSGSALVRVVGTKFNVRSWNVNPKIVVTVSEGKVLLRSSTVDSTRFVMISKGQQSTILPNEAPTIPKNVNVDYYYAWLNNEIHFNNARLGEIVAQLERWFGRKFEFTDSTDLNMKMTIHIRKANLDEVINAITILTSTEVVRKGKLIIFSPENKQKK